MSDEIILYLVYEGDNFFLQQQLMNEHNIIEIIDRLRKNFPPIKIVLRIITTEYITDITLYTSNRGLSSE